MKRLFTLVGMVGLIGFAISAGLPSTPADAQDGGSNPTPNPFQMTTDQIMSDRPTIDHSVGGEVVEQIRPGVPFTSKGQNPASPLVSSYAMTRTSAATISEAMVKTLIATWQGLILPPA